MSSPNAANAAYVALATLVLGACERQPQAPIPPKASPSAKSVIEFPADVEADDPAVNAFVREVIGTCVTGDYERFRLLWNVHEDPFPRGEFERAWKAVRKVRIIVVQKMRNPPEGGAYEGTYLYYVHGRVELDPSVPEPNRDVLLLIIREGEQWRLARAPKNLRTRVLGEQADQASQAAVPVTQPAAP